MVHPAPLDDNVPRDWTAAVAVEVVIFMHRTILAIWRVHYEQMRKFLDSRIYDGADRLDDIECQIEALLDDDIPF